jgi:hypothetical protein
VPNSENCMGSVLVARWLLSRTSAGCTLQTRSHRPMQSVGRPPLKGRSQAAEGSGGQEGEKQ